MEGDNDSTKRGSREVRREPAADPEPAPLTAKPQLDVSQEVQIDTQRGTLTKEAIRRAISKQINAVRLCVEQALQRDPGVVGRKITIRFAIGAAGNVEEASVKESTTGDVGVDKCVVAAFKEMQFPHPEGGGIVVVTYPVWIDGAGG